MNEDEKVDLILVDVGMPLMSGHDLVRVVRAEARFNHVRIKMVTTETSMSDIHQALTTGANEYLMKPFTKDMLIGKLALMGIDCRFWN